MTFKEANIYGKPMIAIAKTLSDWNVPFKLESFPAPRSGYSITFPWHKGDIACNDFTYGHAMGKVETYKFPWDNGDISVMYPYEAVCRVIDLYRELTK